MEDTLLNHEIYLYAKNAEILN